MKREQQKKSGKRSAATRVKLLSGRKFSTCFWINRLHRRYDYEIFATMHQCRVSSFLLLSIWMQRQQQLAAHLFYHHFFPTRCLKLLLWARILCYNRMKNSWADICRTYEIIQDLHWFLFTISSNQTAYVSASSALLFLHSSCCSYSDFG